MSENGQHLAVVVSKSHTQTVIDTLEIEGVYDNTRRIHEWTDETVAIPVTEPPQTVEYREVVRDVVEPRLRTLDDHLRQRGWTDDEIDDAPGSWAVVGTVVLVEMGDAPRPSEVGDALLSLHGGADTVLSRGPISGAHREPDVEVVAGTGDTETVHHEHGTAYALDLAEVMFSPGNQAERVRMGEIVREDDRILDMFAGIGYFSLPMARAGASVTAVERYPTAFRYLVENAALNDVGSLVQPFRADCRDVVDEFAATQRADRVVMGYYEAWEYLESALTALAPGGIVHVHEATPRDLVFDRPIERLEATAAERGRDVEVLDTREVKSYSEGVSHVVVDARVD